MAQMIITMKLMPESPDTDLEDLKSKIKEKVIAFAGEGEMRFEEAPIGFGLSAVNVTFVMDESGESIDKLEEDLKQLEGVASLEVTDMRRALG